MSARRGRRAALALLVAGTPALARQQVPPPPASPIVAGDQPDAYEDRPIREVRILRLKEGKAEREPAPAGTVQLVRNQLRTLEGRPYKHQTVIDDITRLTRLGRYKTVTSQVQLQSDGSVIVVFTITEADVVQDVQVIGNRAITDQDLLAVAGSLSGTPVDRFQLDRAARGMEDLYRTKGYYGARVEIDEKELAESGIVVYRVIEGDRVKVMGVLFEGNRAFSPKELRSAVKTTEYVPIFESGPLDDEVRRDDEAALIRFYKDRGYLDVRASSRIQPSPNGREAIVTFIINEGPLYSVRSVRVVYKTPDALAQWNAQHKDAKPVQALEPRQMAEMGLRTFTAEQLEGVMSLKPGDVYSETRLRSSIDSIRACYGKLGNVVDRSSGPGSIDVRHDVIRDEKLPLVDLLLTIDEGKPYKVGQVVISGNTHTKQQVILKDVRVYPDRPLDSTELADTRTRLENTRLFEPGSVKISIQPPHADAPDIRDVLIEVNETNTGSFNIGAAVSSDSGVIGQVKLTQRNFDLFDTPDSIHGLLNSFRGGGQTATLEIAPGTVTQNYSISLSEPSFLDSSYTASARAYYYRRTYDAYTEKRYGPRAGIGRKFGSVWEGSVALKAEWVGISGFDQTAPQDLWDLPDTSFSTSIAAEFARNTTDNTIRPTKGSRLSLGVEQVGLFGGDFDYTKLKAGYTSFYKLYESFLGYKSILKLDSSAGYIPQGQGSTPLYDRFYLGGQTFRGYDYRGVSPVGIRHDTQTPGTEPVGGVWEFFAGAEINQPIYEDIFSGVLFMDTGTVQTSPGFDQYRVSVGFGFRLYVRALSPVPLAFDFGFPIVKQSIDHERVFTFSVDLPFQ